MEITRYFHFVDNSTLSPKTDPGYDKLVGKIRPVIDHISCPFLTAYNPHCEASIDEAMIVFKERSTMKQYLLKKPVKRGFKVWVRADAVSGYVSKLDMYTGKVAGEFGLGGNIVKRLTRSITGRNHIVYCDNFFISAPLFKDLLKDKILLVGPTTTENVIPKSGLKNRGEYRYAQDSNLLVSL